MAEIIRMPRLSDTMEEGNIIGWLKKVGDKVESGDVLAEVETDKATMELESFEDGTLLHIGVPEGPVPVDGLIAIIGEEGEDIAGILINEASPKASTETPKEENKKEEETIEQKETAPKTTPAPVATQTAPPVAHENGHLKASPLAKGMAKEAGINLSSVAGTGDQGRIVKRDVESFIAQGGQKAVAAPVAQSIVQDTSVEYGDHPVSQMRKTIAKRLGESKFTAPHFYLTIEVNMDNAIAARKSVNENSESRISFNDLVIKACAMALKKHPYVNGSWHGDKITLHQDVNIGVAVAVSEGLLVPVINNADLKPLSYINQEVRELAGKAKSKKLSLQEMQGNTFTISNLGMFGIEEFTAIINPPDACILAVGSIVQKPVVKNGDIVVGNVMKVTLSCDHRIVDGAVGAKFLGTVRQYLEQPLMMMV